jgi:hypothetical protein
MRTRE